MIKRTADGLVINKAEYSHFQLQNGRSVWHGEWQNLIRKYMGKFLPQVEVTDNQILFCMRDDDGKELVSQSIPLYQYHGPEEPFFEEFQEALDSFYDLTNNSSVDVTIRDSILSMKFPNPLFLPETWRVYRNGDDVRLIVLWGFEEKHGDTNMSFLPASSNIKVDEPTYIKRIEISQFMKCNQRNLMSARGKRNILFAVLGFLVLILLLLLIGQCRKSESIKIDPKSSVTQEPSDVGSHRVSSPGEDSTEVEGRKNDIGKGNAPAEPLDPQGSFREKDPTTPTNLSQGVVDPGGDPQLSQLPPPGKDTFKGGGNSGIKPQPPQPGEVNPPSRPGRKTADGTFVQSSEKYTIRASKTTSDENHASFEFHLYEGESVNEIKEDVHWSINGSPIKGNQSGSLDKGFHTVRVEFTTPSGEKKTESGTLTVTTDK